VAHDPTTTMRAFERNLVPQPPPESNATAIDGQPDFLWGGHSAPALRSFVVARATSVMGQLDGNRSGTPGRPGFGGLGGGFD
jgi:hypothetical protein